MLKTTLSLVLRVTSTFVLALLVIKVKLEKMDHVDLKVHQVNLDLKVYLDKMDLKVVKDKKVVLVSEVKLGVLVIKVTQV